MHVREIEWFRDNVANPRMKQLLDNTHIPEGMCCIDYFELSYFDGRSCGTDSQIKASGLLYKDGRVEEYSFDECDISVEEFLAAHKDCVLISDGKLSLRNELEETEVNSRLRNINYCAQLFPEIAQVRALPMELTCMEYVKMKHLLQTQQKEKEPLAEQIQSAQSRSSPQSAGTAQKAPIKTNERML